MNLYESAEPERFRSWVAQRLGLQFDDGKLGFLAEVLVRRAQARREMPRRYLEGLDGPGSDEELRALAHELTVAETYFFRHFDQFRAFAETALPDRVAARADSRMLQLLSAGCASGEEPYSLAILARERVTDPAWTVSIRAVDLNPAVLEKASRGRYSAWALRETPPEIQQRWFRKEGRDAVLHESIRDAVIFQEHNLAREDAELLAPQRYDVIFCRNVLMYFTLEQAQALVARLTRALAPGGYLFLGHAETLRGLSDDYSLCHTHDTFYYQKKDKKEEAAHTRVKPLNGLSYLPPVAAEAPIDPGWAVTWLETVQRATNRIHALTLHPGATPQTRGPSEETQTATGLQLALELLKEERFAEALDLLGRLPTKSAQDPDIALLRAALLTHSGQLAAAEKACAALLERDPLSTGGHYLLALCRESAGDRRGAVDHDQTAVYLDPGFAMPRLHLGLMARRGGDRETARRELSQALLLLQREEASRLLLFGGGFGREALIALCRAEWIAAGGSP